MEQIDEGIAQGEVEFELQPCPFASWIDFKEKQFALRRLDEVKGAIDQVERFQQLLAVVDDRLGKRARTIDQIVGARPPVDVGIGGCFDGDGECTVADYGQPDVRSEEHTSELQSLMRISYAGFCLKKK